MTELARHAGHAVPYSSPKHDSSTHAGAERQHGHVVYVAGRPQPVLAERSRVGIVFQNHSCAEHLLNLRSHRRFRPSRQIRRLAQRAGLHVDNSRHTDANAL